MRLGTINSVLQTWRLKWSDPWVTKPVTQESSPLTWEMLLRAKEKEGRKP